ALQVAAALPGGDPLAAALAAGETPSPDMVAAAGPESAIPTRRAAALLAGVVVLAGSGLSLARWRTDLGLSPLPQPPAVRERRAREIARRLGWAEAPADSASRFVRDYAYLAHFSRGGRAGWSRALGAAWWKPAFFAYRQSPLPMLPANQDGAVRATDP